jgi:hypothetical protein
MIIVMVESIIKVLSFGKKAALDLKKISASNLNMKQG